MIMLVVSLVLQATMPTAAAPDPAASAAVPEGQMSCVHDQASRSRLCTTATGEQLRCRRERVMGSRMPVTLCTSAAEDAALERESRTALDRQQRITTPDRN